MEQILLPKNSMYVFSLAPCTCHRCVVAASHRYKDIQEFVTTDMLPMALELLFDRNMAPVVASLILLLGEILAK